ncbi:type II CAAX endopeptidase family protein [Planococcus shenhongbingii]|uniref:Type II CAAX endopeptidase family protein n=1 Tax=Planococcus shenhongbingii TaxID=3058398 RepID=A0ABT8N9X1_9BACL|nr:MULTISPECIES: type II CAAX endopeptidase family protein [unclassified Planococcus (in: firmicutes)]MDN7244355.1 type II CAAX endopeptidase family protein [Planococcus sp. N017]WKA57522.1 type II CAAX endopeptidase family protein [Planococcus sp. N016]
MLNLYKKHQLILLIPIAFALYSLAFQDTAIFWYMYTFAILVLMSFAIMSIKIFDEMVTWKSLIYGLGYGTLIYAIIAGGFQFFKLLPFNFEASTSSFLSTFAPASIWHFLLLMFVIVPGEEIFWRGFVQQKLKQYFPMSYSVLISSLLFGLALGFGGFVPGMLAGIVTGLILGSLYEWKKSMPLLIIAHLVMLVLLFLVMPLS